MNDVFSQILNMSLTASVIILCVMAARLLLKKAPKVYSYALWAVVLFRLLCPVSLSAPVSLLSLTGPEVTVSQGAASTVVYLPVEESAEEAPQVNREEVQTETVIIPPAPKPSLEAKDIAAAIWLLGITLMALYSMVSYCRLRASLVGAMPYRGNVYLADYIDSPFVLGILRPRIYLPSSTPNVERRYIIAHERHHIRRCDHIVKLLAYAALCIHWFNPLVWAAFILAGKDMEMSCDEAVIRKLGSHIRADYSASLLRLATHRTIIAGTPLAFGEGDTKGRVMNMAHWKKPKVWVSILCTIACIVTLAACAVNPEQNAAADLSEDPLGSCKQVLESVQNSDGYRILTDRQNVGGNILNATSRIRDFKSGDTWLQISKIPEAGWMYYGAQLYRDGVFYDNWNIPGGRDENGHLLWAESLPDSRQKREPWLATFQWEEEKVELLSVEEIEDELQGPATVVHLSIHDSLMLDEHASEDYTVDFQFNAGGEFSKAILKAYFPEIRYTMTNTMFLQSLDGDAVGKEIEAYTQNGLPKPGIAAEDNTITYGSFTVTLPAGYSWQKSEGTGLVLTRNGETVGGITYWNAPDFELTNDNMGEWVTALGLLEAMGGENSYMIDAWSGNYLSAFFIDEQDPMRLNVDHRFFPVGERIYDIWFNNNFLTDSDGSQFLKTVLIDGKPAALEIEETAEETTALPAVPVPEIPAMTQEDGEVSFGDLTLEFPSEYSCSVNENGSLAIHHVDVGAVGGITLWYAPDFEPTTGLTAQNNLDEWVKALGLPEAQFDRESQEFQGEPIGYMIEGPVHNYLSAEYFNERYPQKLNVDHHFFLVDEVVYDVWYNQNIVSDGAAMEFLETVRIKGEPTIITILEPEETGPAASEPAIPAGAAAYTDSFLSDDGSVTINIDAVIVPEELEAENGLAWEELRNVMEKEFRTTNVDSYGLNATAMGYEGLTCQVNIDEFRAGSYLIRKDTAVPTIEVLGTREYFFPNGERLGEEDWGSSSLMTINALNGEILARLGLDCH